MVAKFKARCPIEKLPNWSKMTPKTDTTRSVVSLWPFRTKRARFVVSNFPVAAFCGQEYFAAGRFVGQELWRTRGLGVRFVEARFRFSRN